jgi:hypothetical protein
MKYEHIKKTIIEVPKQYEDFFSDKESKFVTIEDTSSFDKVELKSKIDKIYETLMVECLAKLILNSKNMFQAMVLKNEFLEMHD